MSHYTTNLFEEFGARDVGWVGRRPSVLVSDSQHGDVCGWVTRSAVVADPRHRRRNIYLRFDFNPLCKIKKGVRITHQQRRTLIQFSHNIY